MVYTENLEEAKKQREQSEVDNQKKEQQEKIKNNFNNLPEIKNLSDKLKELVKPNEQEKIENRLLLKYEKNPEGFNLKDSLKKVLLWENIWWIPSSWVLLENEKWETLSKQEKTKIYEKLISSTIEWIEKWQEDKIEIPKSAEPTTKETSEKVWDILDNTKNNSEQTWKDKIQARLWLNDKQINKKLNTPAEREKNINNAKEIFFTKEKISEYIQSPETQLDDKNPLKNFWETIFKEWEIIDEDLQNILWNFIIENWDDDLKTYSLKNPELVNESLNDAFEIEIEKLLKWKNKDNYNSDAIEKIKNNILDDNITKNPLEKLQKFKELKLSLQTSIASKFSKTKKLLEKGNSKELKSEKNRLAKLYNNLKQNLEKIYIKPSENKILKEILENYKKVDEKIKWWDVMQWWKLDKTKTWVEKISENS